MAINQQFCKDIVIINRNKTLIITMILFLIQCVLINISCALNARITGDKQCMTEQLKLEIELDKKVYKPEEPIIIRGKIENLMKKTINLAPVLFMDLLVYLKHDGQEVVPFGPIVVFYEIITKERIAKLQAGESYSFKRVIHKETYMMPTKIGQYEMYVTYSNMTENLEGIELWVGEIMSNVVKFEIK